MQKANDSVGDLSRKKTPKYQSKTTHPKAVTKTGSYFRIINLWFSEQNQHLVFATGKKMNRAELDVGGYRHKSIWDNMADQYNNNTGIPAVNASDGNKGDNSYLDVIQAPHILNELENPKILIVLMVAMLLNLSDGSPISITSFINLFLGITLDLKTGLVPNCTYFTFTTWLPQQALKTLSPL